MLETETERKAKGKWPSRPGLSLALFALIWLAPAAAGLAAGAVVVFALLLISAQGQIAFGLATAAGLGFLLLTIRLTRPLQLVAALFRLSLSFPGVAPTRFSVARLALSSEPLRAEMQGLSLDPRREDGSAAARVLKLALAESVRDPASLARSLRLQKLCALIAKELRLPEQERAQLRWAVLLHDLGELTVPKGALGRPQGPSSGELQQLSSHPLSAAELAGPALTFLGPCAAALKEHHERFDGSGSLGLRGHQISQAARILAVSDLFFELAASGKGSLARRTERASKELQAPGRLDPWIVSTLLGLPERELRAALSPLPSPALPALIRWSLGSTVAAGASLAMALLILGLGAHPLAARWLPNSPPSGQLQPKSSSLKRTSPRGQYLASPSSNKSVGPAANPSGQVTRTPAEYSPPSQLAAPEESQSPRLPSPSPAAPSPAASPSGSPSPGLSPSPTATVSLSPGLSPSPSASASPTPAPSGGQEAQGQGLGGLWQGASRLLQLLSL